VRGACIDIGSNTTRLLVADVAGGGLTEVVSERVFTPLAASAAGGGAVPAELLEEVAAVVARQADRARESGATRIRVLGTAAIRRASNGGHLAEAVAGRAGLPVEVLAPEQEARLAFLGATAAPGAGCREGETVGVIDVGGGSTELAAGLPGHSPGWCASPGIGSADLTARWLGGDPPAEREIAAARAAAGEAFASVRAPAVGRALAVGGSATSLGRLAGTELDPRALQAALDALVADPAAAVARRHALDPRRVALLPAAILLLAAGARAFGVPLRAVRGGVREGAVLEAYAREVATGE